MLENRLQGREGKISQIYRKRSRLCNKGRYCAIIVLLCDRFQNIIDSHFKLISLTASFSKTHCEQSQQTRMILRLSTCLESGERSRAPSFGLLTINAVRSPNVALARLPSVRAAPFRDITIIRRLQQPCLIRMAGTTQETWGIVWVSCG